MNLAGEVLWTSELKEDPNNLEAILSSARIAFEDSKTLNNIQSDRISGVGVSLQGWRSGSSKFFKTPEKILNWSDIDIQQRIHTVLENRSL